MPMKNGIESREQQSDGKKRYRGAVKVDGAWQRGPWGGYDEARAWRSKALGEKEAGTRVKQSSVTLIDAWDDFIAGAKAGTITSRNGVAFKPATIRSYELSWSKVKPEFGAHKLTAVRRRDVQALVDRLQAEGKPAATIRNTFDSLRVLYRRALQRDQVAVNPMEGVVFPRVVNNSQRFASKDEARALLGALQPKDRALWTTAMYGGLRRGELKALRWSDVDLAKLTINVARSWDQYAGEQAPKTASAVRRVPIVPDLLDALKAHATLTGRSGTDLVFGRTADDPFVPSTVRTHALAAWKAAGLDPIELHPCRHTFASMLIAAGANAKALSVVMGHASIGITFDRYGHLMPGGEDEVGRLLGVWLAA